MKARPIIIENGSFVDCDPTEATHIQILIPSGVCENRLLPIQIGGTRQGSENWSWNGDTEKPTLKPSILTCADWAGKPFRCHTFVNDGNVEFLNDCSHEFAGQTLELLDLEEK